MDKEKRLDEILDKIVKQCFWDYDINKYDILNIIKKGNIFEKRKLALKIIKNYKQPVDALLLFPKKDLQKIFESFDEKIKNDEKILLLENCLVDGENRLIKYEWRKFK